MAEIDKLKSETFNGPIGKEVVLSVPIFDILFFGQKKS